MVFHAWNHSEHEILYDAFETIPAVSILANYGHLLTQGNVVAGSE
jgi:hypothetical protein